MVASVTARTMNQSNEGLIISLLPAEKGEPSGTGGCREGSQATPYQAQGGGLTG
jgi:hypothetical protein